MNEQDKKPGVRVGIMIMRNNFLVLITCFLAVFLAVSAIRFYNKEDMEEKKEMAEKKVTYVRQGAVAGAFYSADQEELSQQIDKFLGKVEKLEKRPTIVIVPHAGYSYSGQVAAYGFGQLIDSGVTRVFIIGASHSVPFSGAAIFKEGFWQTPLGKVGVDNDLAAKIIASDKNIFESVDYHSQEHSLEVEIPFLQMVLKNFKIVPILLGDVDENLISALASSLEKYIDEQTIVIISSDLSHYPSYEDAKRVDKETIDSILTGDIEIFEKTTARLMKEGTPNLSTCACGETAIKVGMKIADILGIKDIRLINYANSGDVSGESQRVVGYAAIGFYQERVGYQLNAQEKEELLKISRDTLNTYLKNKEKPDFEINNPFLNRNLGAFVTLKKKGKLRGCIGRFEPDIPLWQVVRDMSIEAAVNDHRFVPVTFEELEDIHIEISVLSPPKKVDNLKEIEISKHGVVVKKDSRSGVFLPQVATDNNWNFDKFMGELCSQKAGLSWDCWKDPSVDLYVFTAQVFEYEVTVEKAP